jgi:dipeptidyl aminopeptidase/acylaminoacyl peptidase
MLPSWQPELNAVVYPIKNFHDINGKTLTFKLTLQIGVSYGNPDTAQLLEDNLPELSVVFKPGGDEMVYLSSKKIFKLDKSLKKLPPISFDFAEWDYAKEQRGKNPLLYSAAWQPRTSIIFLYGVGKDGGGYTFILNADTGQVCELNLGEGWVQMGRWSPDGRYLAVARFTDSHPTVFTLLDSITGDVITLDSPPQGVEGKFYTGDFIWAPDSHHLLAYGRVYLSQNNALVGDAQNLGLYLVDISNKNTYVGAYEGLISSRDYNWAWSPDGSKILIRCPIQAVDRICLISVNQTGQ